VGSVDLDKVVPNLLAANDGVLKGGDDGLEVLLGSFLRYGLSVREGNRRGSLHYPA
jgi:hypothetical protein